MSEKDCFGDCQKDKVDFLFSKHFSLFFFSTRKTAWKQLQNFIRLCFALNCECWNTCLHFSPTFPLPSPELFSPRCILVEKKEKRLPHLPSSSRNNNVHFFVCARRGVYFIMLSRIKTQSSSESLRDGYPEALPWSIMWAGCVPKVCSEEAVVAKLLHGFKPPLSNITVAATW